MPSLPNIIRRWATAVPVMATWLLIALWCFPLPAQETNDSPVPDNAESDTGPARDDANLPSTPAAMPPAPNFIPPPPPNFTPPSMPPSLPPGLSVPGRPSMPSPNFAPPPPPNFTPPAAAAGKPLVTPSEAAHNGPVPRAAALLTPPAQPASPPPASPEVLRDPDDSVMAAEAADSASPAEEMPAEPTSASRLSALVGPDGPDLETSVGLIRIPELGTNEILEMLENFTAKPIFRQQSLPAVKITFYSQGPMTRGEAILALESLLSINGIAVTTVGQKFLKAVPAASVVNQVPPIFTGSTLEARPSQQIYSKLFELNFLTPTETATLIQPLMSQGSPLIYEKSRILMITDSLINLQRIETVLQTIDRRSIPGVVMLLFTLKNISAEDASKRLQTLQQGALKSQLENNTTFDADQRTNQLIIFTHPSNKELLNDLIKQLDVDVTSMTRTEVYSIKYAEATEVAALIQEIVTGQKQARPDKRSSSGGSSSSRGPSNTPPRVPTPQSSGGSGELKSVQFSDYFNAIPDERANTIIATGTPTDHVFLAQLIDKIDTVLAQVRIEVVIVSVSLTKGFNYGLDAFKFAYNRTAMGSGGAAGGNDTMILPELKNQLLFNTPLVFGPGDFSLDLVLQQARTDGRVHVLSAPTIVTTHNREASIIVGESRPFVTSRYDSGAGSTTTGDRFTANYNYRDVGIELKVKPLIGSNGIIQLEIDQKVDNVAAGSETNTEAPIIQKRQATSFVSVMDRQMVVLGGLQSHESNRGNGRIWLFGELPVIGDIINPRVSSDTRNELLIFIRPTIIGNSDDSFQDAKEMIDRLDSKERVQKYLETGRFEEPKTEPTPPKDYTRRRK